MAGSSDTDPNANCLSAGMPGMMSMAYGMEIQQTKDKITIYGELNDVYRRIYLDGRKPPTANARRSDVRRVFRGALGRGHARRGHRGHARGHAARPVLAAQRSAHRARAHQIYVAWHPRGSDDGNGSEGVARTLHPDSYVSESIAAKRRTARVLVCRGPFVGQVGRSARRFTIPVVMAGRKVVSRSTMRTSGNTGRSLFLSLSVVALFTTAGHAQGPQPGRGGPPPAAPLSLR